MTTHQDEKPLKSTLLQGATPILHPGQRMADGTIFLGAHTPENRSGRSLGKTYNLFAAAHDLGMGEDGRGMRLVETFNNAVKAVAEIKNLHGYAGFNHAAKPGTTPDKALLDQLADGRYNGEWFIPTCDIARGSGLNGNATQNDNLYQHRNTGAFANSFMTASSPDLSHWSWTSTAHPLNTAFVFDVDFATGNVSWSRKDEKALSTRLVRAELRP